MLANYAEATENIAVYTRFGWTETPRDEQGGYERAFMRKPSVVK